MLESGAYTTIIWAWGAIISLLTSIPVSSFQELMEKLFKFSRTLGRFPLTILVSVKLGDLKSSWGSCCKSPICLHVWLQLPPRNAFSSFQIPCKYPLLENSKQKPQEEGDSDKGSSEFGDAELTENTGSYFKLCQETSFRQNLHKRLYNVFCTKALNWETEGLKFSPHSVSLDLRLVSGKGSAFS